MGRWHAAYHHRMKCAEAARKAAKEQAQAEAGRGKYCCSECCEDFDETTKYERCPICGSHKWGEVKP